VDKYTRIARVQPALLAALPLVLAGLGCAGGVVSPVWAALWGVLTWAGASTLISQISRQAGLRQEKRLVLSWGGLPTTQLLRHGGPTNRTTLRRWHGKLEGLIPGMTIPSEGDEREDPKKADEVYDSCILFLRERTKDNKVFPLVFAENCSYGFRRNLFGLKAVGVALSLIGMGAIGARVVIEHRSQAGLLPPMLYVAGGLEAVLLLVWGVLITPEWVREAAQAYADRLLGACEIL
jgi:hypothetical protein